MVSNYQFSAFFCMSSHSEATVWVSSACWTYRKLSFFFFFPLLCSVWDIVSCLAAKLTLICPPAVRLLESIRKAGAEAHSQRAEAGWTVGDCPSGGKPQFCWLGSARCHTLRMVCSNPPLYKLLLQKEQVDFRQSQTKHWHLLLSHQLTIELCLTLTSCFGQFPFSFTIFGVFSFFV